MSKDASETAPKLTSAELGELVRRAAARHEADGDRLLGREDLVETARELGIPESTVDEVWLEHERRQASLPEALPRPRGTDLVLEVTPERLHLSIPPSLGRRITAGLQLAATGAFGALFATTISTHTHWTTVLGAGAFFTLVSAWATWRGFARTELTLGRDRGKLVRALGNIGFVTPLETAQLHVRVDETRETRGNATTLLRFVALDHGTETHRLLIDAAPAEHRWVQNALERWLKS